MAKHTMSPVRNDTAQMPPPREAHGLGRNGPARLIAGRSPPPIASSRRAPKMIVATRVSHVVSAAATSDH